MHGTKGTLVQVCHVDNLFQEIILILISIIGILGVYCVSCPDHVMVGMYYWDEIHGSNIFEVFDVSCVSY